MRVPEAREEHRRLTSWNYDFYVFNWPVGPITSQRYWSNDKLTGHGSTLNTNTCLITSLYHRIYRIEWIEQLHLINEQKINIFVPHLNVIFDNDESNYRFPELSWTFDRSISRTFQDCQAFKDSVRTHNIIDPCVSVIRSDQKLRYYYPYIYIYI